VDTATIAEKAAGSKAVKSVAIAGSAGGFFGLIYTFLQKLTGEQLVYLAEKMGVPFLVVFMLFILALIIGPRGISGAFKLTNEVAGLRGSLSEFGASLRAAAETLTSGWASVQLSLDTMTDSNRELAEENRKVIFSAREQLERGNKLLALLEGIVRTGKLTVEPAP